jgi:hypothetical protein
MHSPFKTARIAGLLYSLTVVGGIFSMMYVPGHVIVHDDTAATVSRMLASESLVRLGIVVNVVSHVAFFLLPLCLYKLLAPVSKEAAVMMVALGLACVPFDLLAVADQLNIAVLLHDQTYRHALSPGLLQAQVWSLLDASDSKLSIAQVFWGLWLMPFGYLVYRCGFLPRLLGVFLMLGCFSYLANFFAQILRPDDNLPGFVMWPDAIGEIGIALWLLIFGVSRRAIGATQAVAR